MREPSLVGGLTAGGQLRVGVFYTGEDDGGRFAVGYAGSDDLRVFQRFRQGSAVLETKLADERGPSAVIEPARGVLFFAQKAVLARGMDLCGSAWYRPRVPSSG